MTSRCVVPWPCPLGTCLAPGARRAAAVGSFKGGGGVWDHEGKPLDVGPRHGPLPVARGPTGAPHACWECAARARPAPAAGALPQLANGNCQLASAARLAPAIFSVCAAQTLRAPRLHHRGTRMCTFSAMRATRLWLLSTGRPRGGWSSWVPPLPCTVTPRHARAPAARRPRRLRSVLPRAGGTGTGEATHAHLAGRRSPSEQPSTTGVVAPGATSGY